MRVEQFGAIGKTRQMRVIGGPKGRVAVVLKKDDDFNDDALLRAKLRASPAYHELVAEHGAEGADPDAPAPTDTRTEGPMEVGAAPSAVPGAPSPAPVTTTAPVPSAMDTTSASTPAPAHTAHPLISQCDCDPEGGSYKNAADLYEEKDNPNATHRMALRDAEAFLAFGRRELTRPKRDLIAKKGDGV